MEKDNSDTIFPCANEGDRVIWEIEVSAHERA